MNILRKARDFLGTRNGIRLVAVAAAVVVWYSIRAATSNSMLITDIPLSIQPPPDWVVVERSARTVDVAFLGTRDDLRYLNRELIKATVDARHRTDSGTFVVPLGPVHINAPGNARIEFIRPSSLTLRLDREITKQVPVKLETQNLLPDGYEIEKVVVTPAAVQLTGPAGRIETVEAVSTIPVDLDGHLRSINKRRIALTGHDAAAGVTLDPAAVTLDVVIVERSVTSQFPDMPVSPLMPPGRALRADLDPETASITVKGRPELIKALAADHIRLFVDAAEITGSRAVKLPIRAVLPAGISLVQAEPSTVSVRLKE